MRMLFVGLLFSFLSITAVAQMKSATEDLRGMMPGTGKIDYEKLVELFTDAIKQYPDKPSQYNNRAVARYKLQDFTGALTDLDKAIELSPNYPNAHYNSGLIKLKQKNYAGAIEDFKLVMDIVPKDTNAYYNSALAKYYTGKKEEALSDLDKALKLSPGFEWALCNSGVIKNEMDKSEEAIQLLTKAIGINAKDGDYYNNRGQAYQKAGNANKACDDFKKGAELGSAKAAERAASCK
ncbi:MAG: tetratricopeptide repeat protein [Chitinophagales bacterium]|nr:tetratricopeptide repeat protein [Chitinophagales bacterium]